MTYKESSSAHLCDKALYINIFSSSEKNRTRRTEDEDNLMDSTFYHNLRHFYCNCFDIIIYLFISSPQHKALKMRYCDSPMSVVRQ